MFDNRDCGSIVGNPKNKVLKIHANVIAAAIGPISPDEPSFSNDSG